MNFLRSLGLGGKSKPPNPKSDLRDKLPQVNAFVEVAVGSRRQRESVAVNAIEGQTLTTRALAGLEPGTAADFLYANATGRFRFTSVCSAIDPEANEAHFDLPESIKTIELFANRRMQARVPWLIPVQWRYAPDGEGYGDFLPASMMDLSIGGASLVVDRELKAGSQVEVRFSLKSKGQPLVELCQVVRAAKIATTDKNAAGIQFLDVDRDDERVLTDFIAQRQALRRDRGVV